MHARDVGGVTNGVMKSEALLYLDPEEFKLVHNYASFEHKTPDGYYVVDVNALIKHKGYIDKRWLIPAWVGKVQEMSYSFLDLDSNVVDLAYIVQVYIETDPIMIKDNMAGGIAKVLVYRQQPVYD